MSQWLIMGASSNNCLALFGLHLKVTLVHQTGTHFPSSAPYLASTPTQPFSWRGKVSNDSLHTAYFTRRCNASTVSITLT